jgi:putative ABC transport system permease protein
VKSSSLIDGLAGSFIYLPLQQHYASDMTATMTIAARSRNGGRLVSEIRAAVAAMDPNLAIVSSQTLEESTALGLLPQRIVASVSGSLGGVALLLAAIGIYGVTAYTVARRTREIGIRIALGAARRDILGMVLRQGLWLAGLGSIAGLGLAAGVSRFLSGLLFGLEPLDPPTFVGTAALFLMVGLTACYLPARRAATIDPLAALRDE